MVLPQLVLLQTQMLTSHLGESRVPVPTMVQVQPIYVPQLQQQGPGKLQSKRQRTENIFVPQCKCMARNVFPVTLRQSVAMMSGVPEQAQQGQMLSFAMPADQAGRSCSTRSLPSDVDVLEEVLTAGEVQLRGKLKLRGRAG